VIVSPQGEECITKRLVPPARSRIQEVAVLEKLSQSSGNILGYKVIGKIIKADYSTLTADIQALEQEEIRKRLLLDLEAFEGEEIKTCGAKISFRGDYQKRSLSWP
jgi:hypothetical protein